MAVLSTLFEKHFSSLRCNELLHPHSCRRATVVNLWHFFCSNGKYYVPVVLLHLLKQSLRESGNILNILQDTIWYHQQLTLGGLINGWVIATTMCALRHLLGEFQQYSLVFLPSIVGGIFTTFLPERVKHLQHTGIFQSFIESLLLQRKVPMTGVLSSSLTLQTLLFMCCSAIIMESKQKGWHKGFWFLRPESLAPNDNAVNTCTHEEPNCALHIVRGMRNYCLIGLALDIFKALVSCTKSGQWSLSHFSLESVFWLVCYIGIYRVSHCYLMGKEDNRIGQKHLLASFLAGLSFICYPKRTILSFGLLEAIRSLWARHKPSFKCGYGWSDVLFPMILAFLIHNYVLDPNSVSGLATAIINNTTANYALNINKRLLLLQPTKGRQT